MNKAHFAFWFSLDASVVISLHHNWRMTIKKTYLLARFAYTKRYISIREQNWWGKTGENVLFFALKYSCSRNNHWHASLSALAEWTRKKIVILNFVNWASAHALTLNVWFRWMQNVIIKHCVRTIKRVAKCIQYVQCTSHYNGHEKPFDLLMKDKNRRTKVQFVRIENHTGTQKRTAGGSEWDRERTQRNDLWHTIELDEKRPTV